MRKGILEQKQAVIEHKQATIDRQANDIQSLENRLKESQEAAAKPTIIPKNQIVDLKQDLRSFLESVNPAVLKLVDSDKRQIPVMLGSRSQNRLSLFEERDGFKKYISYTRRPDVMAIGGGNQIGGWIMDESQDGVVIGYLLVANDALKRIDASWGLDVDTKGNADQRLKAGVVFGTSF